MVIIAQLFQPLLAEGRMVHSDASDSQPMMHSMNAHMAMQHQLHQMHGKTNPNASVNSAADHANSSMMDACCETVDIACDSHCADHQCTVISTAPLFATHPVITLSLIENTHTLDFPQVAMFSRNITPEDRPPLV